MFFLKSKRENVKKMFWMGDFGLEFLGHYVSVFPVGVVSAYGSGNFKSKLLVQRNCGVVGDSDFKEALFSLVILHASNALVMSAFATPFRLCSGITAMDTTCPFLIKPPKPKFDKPTSMRHMM